MILTLPTFRPEVQLVLERHAASTLALTSERERWQAYEDAKRALSAVCESSGEYMLAVQAYARIARL
jgi:hypothetical protein